MSKEAFKAIVSDPPDIQQAVTQHAMNDMANMREAAQPSNEKGMLAQVFSAIVNSDVVQDGKSELGRLGVQGQAEMAGALFNGNAYVPYGAGQHAPEPEKAQEQQQQMERGGMER